MLVPGWALSVVYWLHMLATVIWIGGLAALTLLILPTAAQTTTSTSVCAIFG